VTPAAFHRAILRSAALLVPESQRPDWLAEWRSELWHVRRDPHGRNQNITAFCMGAFRDAFWLWRNGPNVGQHGILCLNGPATPEGIESFPDQGEPLLSSPVCCLSWLAALGVLCAAVALFLPSARIVLLSSLYPRNLVMLSPAEDGDPSIQNGFMDPYPTVSRAQFESLKSRDGDEFEALTFYAPARTPGSIQHDNDLKLLIPSHTDLQLIEDETSLAALPAATLGFVVGRLRYGTLRDSRFDFVRLPDRSLGLFSATLAFFLFACVLVAIVTSRSPGGHLRRTGPRRTLFLAAKAALLLPIVAFGSLDSASLGGSVSPLFFDIALCGSLFAARWMFADQCNRCPVCLRLLANPVRIGASSRILLEWHGTELMCLRGHGLLYVPEWPAIWSGRQSWMALGPSWGGLFPRRGPAKAIPARQ
jgi:hypothetical protein